MFLHINFNSALVKNLCPYNSFFFCLFPEKKKLCESMVDCTDCDFNPDDYSSDINHLNIQYCRHRL